MVISLLGPPLCYIGSSVPVAQPVAPLQQGEQGGGAAGGISMGLGAKIEKERAAPRGVKAKGRSDGRRPCARAARERGLSLVRALSLVLALSPHVNF